MSFVYTEAIVLKKMKYGESSSIITLFSREYGKFSVVAKGSRSAKSKYSGVFETMNHISVHFNKNDRRELQYVTKAEPVSTFPGIKEDFDKIMLTYRILELNNKLLTIMDNNDALFDFNIKILNHINSDIICKDSLFLFYLLVFSELLGVGIDMTLEENIHKADRVNDETFGYLSSFNISKESMSMLRIIRRTDIRKYCEANFDISEITKLTDLVENNLLKSFQTNPILSTKKILYQIN